MNRVSADTPLVEIAQMMVRDGYVLIEGALSSEQLAPLQAAYDEQLHAHTPSPRPARVEVPRILERDARFEVLMDNPSIFSVARAMLGYDIELATGGELDHKFARTPSHIGWHNDFVWMTNLPYPRQNFWLRATYLIEDVTEAMGPFTLLPSSHLQSGPPRAEFNDPDGQPRDVPGMLRVTGKAGDCLISNTELWHTNTPNTSDCDRKIVFVLYKHAWMKQWQDGYEMSPEFCARQTDPLRRQLCGHILWHQGEAAFPAGAWTQ